MDAIEMLWAVEIILIQSQVKLSLSILMINASGARCMDSEGLLRSRAKCVIQPT
jgi:hypothetical protein